tara:strand:+ start:3592 stop:3930 length:339 start_codon:yes stop_codon:yes gene_type:complete
MSNPYWCADAIDHRAKFNEVESELGIMLTNAFAESQKSVRFSESWLNSVPNALLQNGASQAKTDLLRKLDELDNYFIEAFKSLKEQYGEVLDAEEEGDQERTDSTQKDHAIR